MTNRLAAIEESLQALGRFKPRGRSERMLVYLAVKMLTELIARRVRRGRGQERGYLMPGEVARLFKVKPVTVRAWASRGELTSEVTAGGHHRFSLPAVEQFARRRFKRLQA